jgi:hypothetical protein
MPRDDFVRVILDPQITRRDGYVFEMNPLGGRTVVCCRTTPTYCSTGMRCGAVSGAFPMAGQWKWPFHFAPCRSIPPTRNGVSRSSARSSASQNHAAYAYRFQRSLSDISLAGTLLAPQNLQTGLGLDVQLYGIGRYTHDWTTGNSLRKLEPSATTYYKFTPALTSTLT